MSAANSGSPEPPVGGPPVDGSPGPHRLGPGAGLGLGDALGQTVGVGVGFGPVFVIVTVTGSLDSKSMNGGADCVGPPLTE